MSSVWTSREVHFQCFPRTTNDAFDSFMDAAVDLYWETWRHRALGTLSIASTGLRLEISGWPWWVPKWCARRSVASLADSANVGGEAFSHTARAVLV